MPDYKTRKIKLAPERRANGLWQCPYMIIEFRPTCWAYRKGCPEGSFASRQEAATAALEEAKRLVDSLEPSTGSAGQPRRGSSYLREQDEKSDIRVRPRPSLFLENCPTPRVAPSEWCRIVTTTTVARGERS